MKQFAVKDIASLFCDADIRVCWDGCARGYNPRSPLDVAAYGDLCVGSINSYDMEQNGNTVNLVELNILYEPVMCAG